MSRKWPGRIRATSTVVHIVVEKGKNGISKSQKRCELVDVLRGASTLGILGITGELGGEGDLERLQLSDDRNGM